MTTPTRSTSSRCRSCCAADATCSPSRSTTSTPSTPSPSTRRRCSTRSPSVSANASASPVAATSTADDADGFAEAVALAAECDVAVMVMGDKAGLTDDCTSGESRDVASLDLPGVQEELVQAVLDTGTPVVLVLVAGRPIGERGAARTVRGGADGLAARRGGRRRRSPTCSPVRSTRAASCRSPTRGRSGQIPVYYGHKVSGGRSHWKGDYVDSPAAPLYPFGHGVELHDVRAQRRIVERDEVSWNEAITTSVTVTNTGGLRRRRGRPAVRPRSVGERDAAGARAQGLRARVSVAPASHGGSRSPRRSASSGSTTATSPTSSSPGEIDVFVGTSSVDLVEAGTVTVVADSTDPPAKALRRHRDRRVTDLRG